jgi:cell division septum initiation protein DivIVA
MYISTWIIVAVIIAVIYFYSRFKKGNPNLTMENESLTAEEMWKRAETNMEKVLSKSPNLEDYLKDEREMVKAMEIDMARLRERFKHDSQRQIEIARDWMDYSGSVDRIKSSREWLDVDMSDNAYDSHFERTKKAHIAIQEISKRVEDILGKDSNSKLVHDRLKKNAKIADEVLNDFSTKK